MDLSISNYEENLTLLEKCTCYFKLAQITDIVVTDTDWTAVVVAEKDQEYSRYIVNRVTVSSLQ